MKLISSLSICIVVLSQFSCGSYEVTCGDSPLVPYFKGFSRADIDTFIVRKFAPNTGFSQQLDSTRIEFGVSGSYTFQHDTTIVRLDRPNNIIVGYDWQIFIPALNRTINISDISSEQRSMRCGKGLFSTDKTGCYCNNQIFSYKKNGLTVNNIDRSYEYVLYIQ